MCAAADNAACRNATVEAEGQAALPLVGAYAPATMPKPPPPPAQELKCWAAISQICAQNNTKYAPNQTECLQCAEQHAGCEMQPVPPGSNLSKLVCPISPDFPPRAGWACPEACGTPHATYINNTNKTKGAPPHVRHNETTCESTWFAAACRAMEPPRPPPRPIPAWHCYGRNAMDKTRTHYDGHTAVPLSCGQSNTALRDDLAAAFETTSACQPVKPGSVAYPADTVSAPQHARLCLSLCFHSPECLFWLLRLQWSAWNDFKPNELTVSRANKNLTSTVGAYWCTSYPVGVPPRGWCANQR